MSVQRKGSAATSSEHLTQRVITCRQRVRQSRVSQKLAQHERLLTEEAYGVDIIFQSARVFVAESSRVMVDEQEELVQVCSGGGT